MTSTRYGTSPSPKPASARPSPVAKLSVPRVAQVLRRGRISEHIEHATDGGVAWLAAPAGYGKTTAVVDYLQQSGAPHIWLRIDEGDQDVARLFHYLAMSRDAGPAMPVFGAEYAEQPIEFARRFFRAFFAGLEPGTVLVLDDLHDADTPEFRRMLEVLFRELPDTLRCIGLSRTLPQEELSDLAMRGRIIVIGREDLEFSDSEAHELLALRLQRADAAIDVGPAHGWAVGLVLLAESGFAANAADADTATPAALLDSLGRQFFQNLPSGDIDILQRLNFLPDIGPALAEAMLGSDAGRILDWLYQRQLLVTRSQSSPELFQLHDLLRDYLARRLARTTTSVEQAELRVRAAMALQRAGRSDEAIPLALAAEDWALARELMLARAETVLAEGRRASFVEWCNGLPDTERDGWLCYWLGAAHMPDDSAAEHWFSRAWELFEREGDRRGEALTISRAVLAKTDSWRTYEGLSTWTRRALATLEAGLPALSADDELLVEIGMVRALNFADEYYAASDAGHALVEKLLGRLARPTRYTSSMRLLASESLIEHSITIMDASLFAKAVDSVVDDLSDPAVLPSALGNWLVAFGAKSGRYFPYARKRFPYPSAEAALRAAIEIGERESLRGVEFGALYHLQMQMKFRNNFGELKPLVTRLSEIADSRFTTQVAVVADCLATLHARRGAFADAYREVDRFMAAIEAANEPMLERLPHYLTWYQMLLADRKPAEAMALLTALLPRLDGGGLKRIELCILAAEALATKWQGGPGYPAQLQAFVAELRGTRWPMVLLNLPELLAELLADALEAGIETEFCHALIAERRLAAPASRPASWPWALRVRVLGGFRIERDGALLEPGPKAPTRALDILRLLAISRDNTVSLETLQDRLWPDLDGDQARAACEQALHRLRKLLGQSDLLVQREGKLWLAPDKAWVDLADWDARLAATRQITEGAELEQVFERFAGPLLLHERSTAWALPTAERVERDLTDLALRAAAALDASDAPLRARAVLVSAREHYPESPRLLPALRHDLAAS